MEEEDPKLVLGIDPGMRNMGVALVNAGEEGFPLLLAKIIHPYDGTRDVRTLTSFDLAQRAWKALRNDTDLLPYWMNIRHISVESQPFKRQKKMVFIGSFLLGAATACGYETSMPAKRTYFPSACNFGHSENKRVSVRKNGPEIHQYLLAKGLKIRKMDDVCDAMELARWAAESHSF